MTTFEKAELPVFDEEGIWWNALCRSCKWEGEMLIYRRSVEERALYYCPVCGKYDLLPFLYTRKTQK